MITYQAVARPYVASANLQTLTNSFDKLEEGHKEAVKAASELQAVVGKYDMNEQEDSFKQALVDSIDNVVKENTIYGNAYGALDDIMLKAGKLASDPAVNGRLKAQAEFKAFQKQIDDDKTLPADYKEYFKEKNPYYYKDKKDKNGKIIGGSTWQANTNPTTVVPLNQLLDQGLKWAAKESGGGSKTQWLDADGHVTSDPSKAYDGQVFSETTGQWERLSREKIWQGVQASIASTPGAKESLQQDYDVAYWKWQKGSAENRNKPFISDITDEQGRVLSPMEYLHKRVDPMMQAASYYNSTSKTTYGSGLASYKAGMAAAAKNAAIDELSMNNARMSGRNTPVEVQINAAANFLSGKQNAANSIKELYKNLTGRPLYTGDGNINVNKLVQNATKRGVTGDNLNTLKRLANTYNDYNTNLSMFTKNMSDDDKKQFEFATRMQAGGTLINSANGGTKWDDKAIDMQNRLFGAEGTVIRINLSTKTANILQQKINAGQINNYKNLGISFEGDKLIIPKTSMNAIPMIFNALKDSERIANKGFWGTLYFGDRFTIETLNNKGEVIGNNYTNKQGKAIQAVTPQRQRNINYDIVGKFADLYNKSTKINADINNKYNLNATNAIFSSLNLDGSNFTEATLLNQFNKGLISKEEYEKNKKYFEDSFDAILRNHDFSQTDMYYGEENGVRKRVLESGDRLEYGTEILNAIKDKRATITPSIVPGINDPLSGAPIGGYNITILTDEGSGKPGKRKSFYIPGLVNETASNIMMQDPYIRAWQKVSIAGATKSNINLSSASTNPKLGNINIQGRGNNTYTVNIFGKTLNISQDDACTLATALNNYNAVKDMYQSTGTLNKNARSTFVDAAKKIGQVTGISASVLGDYLQADLSL